MLNVNCVNLGKSFGSGRKEGKKRKRREGIGKRKGKSKGIKKRREIKNSLEKREKRKRKCWSRHRE